MISLRDYAGLVSDIPPFDEIRFRITFIPFNQNEERDRLIQAAAAEAEELAIAFFTGDPEEVCEDAIEKINRSRPDLTLNAYDNLCINTYSATLEPNLANAPHLRALLLFMHRHFLWCSTVLVEEIAPPGRSR